MIIRLEKSKMENEEGTNHLLIELPSSLASKEAQVDIRLPDGVFRLNNLNGYHEDKNGTILIDDFSKEQDLIIEIFTQEPIKLREGTVSVELKYKDKQNQEKIINHSILLSFVSEDEMEHLVIDGEVTDRVKQIVNQCSDDGDFQETEFVVVPPKIQNVSNQISELEKKYRVDFSFNSIMMWR